MEKTAASVRRRRHVRTTHVFLSLSLSRLYVSGVFVLVLDAFHTAVCSWSSGLRH